MYKAHCTITLNHVPIGNWPDSQTNSAYKSSPREAGPSLQPLGCILLSVWLRLQFERSHKVTETIFKPDLWNYIPQDFILKYICTPLCRIIHTPTHSTVHNTVLNHRSKLLSPWPHWKRAETQWNTHTPTHPHTREPMHAVFSSICNGNSVLKQSMSTCSKTWTIFRHRLVSAK